MTDRPPDASGEYNYPGTDTWIKELDTRNPRWPLAYVWSHSTKRWRAKRERVFINHIKMFEPALAANVANQRRVNLEIVAAILPLIEAGDASRPQDIAKRIVAAMSHNDIPYVSICY